MMNAILLESPSPAALSFLMVPDYSTFLHESIPHFLTLSQTPASDFSSTFRSIFFRLINSSPDPPVEVLWFYSAVVYHDSIASSKDTGVSAEISGVRYLLQMLVTSSATWSGVRSVAVVAPVISEACRVVRELDVGREGSRKVWKEMDELVDGIVGYICICCAKREEEERENTISLLPCFAEVIRVWMVKSKDEESWVRRFFPLVSVEICGQLVGDGSLGGCGGDVEYLASVVCVQAFMLKLFLKLRSGRISEMKDLGNELKVWAVSSITGFGNIRFFEMLLKLLLESTLPSIFQLNPKDETFLRSILCDAVLLLEYKFLHPTNMEQFHDSLRSLALTRLIVAHEAIQTARKNGDHSKVISYIDAFSRSSLRLGLTKWITNQIGMSTFSSSNATTPQAMLKWILKLEEQGFILFDINILKDRMEYFDELDPVCENHMLKEHNRNADADLFFIDNKGETAGDEDDNDDDSHDQEMEVVDRAFLSAARSMSKSNGGRRKRKEMKGDQEEFNVNFVKYTLHDNSAKEYFSALKEDVSNSGSEVEDPISDEDMEETEA